jgi:hypothetical protein
MVVMEVEVVAEAEEEEEEEEEKVAKRPLEVEKIMIRLPQRMRERLNICTNLLVCMRDKCF